jgi:hypothetical protein
MVELCTAVGLATLDNFQSVAKNQIAFASA